jgi:diguanylate cyclase (GGDEF)-like protein
MPRRTADVLLISDDPHLRELVTQHQPPGAALHCAGRNELPTLSDSASQEVWVDLDGGPCPRVPTAHRTVYFYSDPATTNQGLPAGLFIHKPCPAVVLDVLWAGAELVPTSRRPAGPVARAGTLPAWLLGFQLLDLPALCRKLVVELPALLGYRDASLYLHEARQGLLTLAETTHARPIDLTVPLDATNRLMAAVARQGKPLRTPHAPRALAAHGLTPEPARGYPDDECLVIPLECDQRLCGVLNLSGRTPAKAAAPVETPTAAFAFLGRALHHAWVYEQARLEARVDGLTGLYNQRWMTETLAKEIRRAQRFNLPLSVLMIDVDGLKAVNDQVGHAAGDCLLRHTASRITGALRRFDGAARVGGDEFVVMLPATDLSGAAHVGQRMLGSLRTDPAQFQGRALAMTASLGAAQWRTGWDSEQLLRVADAALYRAKRRGRNQLVCTPAARTSGRATERPKVVPTTEVGAPVTPVLPETRVAAHVSDAPVPHREPA